jgi:undecaprenyl diphosphate synthase
VTDDPPGPSSEEARVPRVVAIVMDGNGRWAEAQRVEVAEGHRAGTRALRRTVEAAIDLGIETLVVYAFSTENWLRPAGEVADLMEIFSETIDRELPDLAEQGVRTRFLGRRDRLEPWLEAKMAALEDTTKHLDTLELWIAFDYGGRAEIAHAARRLVEEGVAAERVDEDALAERLYAPDLREIDLLVRTSGELRLSNFMLWEAAYAELVFTDTLWPDFGEDDLRAAVEAFAARKRRFGARERVSE